MIVVAGKGNVDGFEIERSPEEAQEEADAELGMLVLAELLMMGFPWDAHSM